MEALVAVAVLVALALAARRWGVDSTDGIASPEWDRRRAWRGFARVESKENRR